jgi:hypothetical protein
LESATALKFSNKAGNVALLPAHFTASILTQGMACTLTWAKLLGKQRHIADANIRSGLQG